MEIKNSAIYHLPTEKLKKDFLGKCQKQGFKWRSGKSAFDLNAPYYGLEHCISISKYGLMEYSEKGFYQRVEPYRSFPLILWKIDKPKPTVIKLPNGHKIVFNEPYTIYTDGTFTGKAKCNPADEYNAAAGLVLAVTRYKESLNNSRTIFDF